ncbi:MAG: glycosyltransferase [Planctomycetota bacterium]|nr:glycosyltransferase [Planctomycetota bacterium]
MTPAQVLLLSIYVPMTVLLACYGLHRVHMVVEYLRTRKKNPVAPPHEGEWPRILVQIPVFNERAVVRRILGAVSAMDYPRDKLRVQVLDDSNDETIEISAAACAELRETGMEVDHVRRPNREGFKAGALAHGLTLDDSEFVAIFDADFMPPKDVLKEMIPFFADDGVGLVQSRWEHLNLERNLLTRLQSYLIDGHFILEHTYRHRTGRFFNFNGTAGMWRRKCIDDAGGWSSSSITEDTEISFRAYVKGWKFVYLRDLTCPAELPADIDAYKSQQHRWAKGYTEVLQQHFGTIWRAPIKLKAKIEATLMLSNHFAFLLMGALTILHLPLLIVRTSYPSSTALRLLDMLGLSLVVIAFFAFYFISQWETKRLSLRRVALIPVCLGLAIAQMVNSSRAVLESLFGVKTGFIRTPKEGEGRAKSYKAAAGFGQALTEVVFGLYLLFSCTLMVSKGHFWGAPLNLLVSFGFFYLGLGTLRNRWRAVAPAPSTAAAPAGTGHDSSIQPT